MGLEGKRERKKERGIRENLPERRKEDNEARDFVGRLNY